MGGAGAVEFFGLAAAINFPVHHAKVRVSAGDPRRVKLRLKLRKLPVAVGNHVGIFKLQGVHRVLQLADLRQEAVDLRVIVDDRRLLGRRHIFFNGNFHVLLRLLAQPLDFRLQCLDLRQHPGIGFRLTLRGQGHPAKGFLARGLERGRLAGRQGRL